MSEPFDKAGFNSFEQLVDIYTGRQTYNSTEEWIANMDALMEAACDRIGYAFAPQSQPPAPKMPISEVRYTQKLRDARSLDLSPSTARIVIKPDGVFIGFEGYGEKTAVPRTSCPIMIEIFDGHPRVIVWGDINEEDPTSVLSLEGAQESKRREGGG